MMNSLRTRYIALALVIIGVAAWTLTQSIRPSKQGDATPNVTPLKATPVVDANPNAVARSPGITEPDKAFRDAFDTPITFFGRVTDQHGEPVAGADIKFSINNDPIGGRASEVFRKSDNDGLFSIEGVSGITLLVAVSKPGYRGIPRTHSKIVTSSGLFQYALQGPHRPDRRTPVMFKLHKQGVIQQLVRVRKNVRIARDGTLVSVPLGGQQGSHEIVLRCWNSEMQRPPGQRKYDWKFEVSVKNGGLLSRPNEFLYEAPEHNYSPSDSVDMPAALPQNQWHGFAKRDYFVRFDDGVYARVKLEMRAGGDHFVVVDSYLNPHAGARNLENDPSQDSFAR